MNTAPIIAMARALLDHNDRDLRRSLGLAYSRVENQDLWRQLREMGVCLFAQQAKTWEEGLKLHFDFTRWKSSPQMVPYPRAEAPTYHCEICTEATEDRWDRMAFREVVGVQRRDRLCFTCAFWTKKIENKGYMSRVAVIGDVAHHPQPAVLDSTWGRMLGCAGARFTILYPDGRVVRSNDVWVQGDIPGAFRSYFPGEATTLKEDAILWEKMVRLQRHEDECWTQVSPGDFVRHPNICRTCTQVLNELDSGESEAPV